MSFPPSTPNGFPLTWRTTRPGVYRAAVGAYEFSHIGTSVWVEVMEQDDAGARRFLDLVGRFESLEKAFAATGV